MTSTILSIEDTRVIVRHVGLDSLMDAIISRLSRALENFDERETIVPVRAGFDYTVPNLGLLEWMPIMKIGRMVTMKIVGYHPSNPAQKKLPTILSTMLAIDTATGHLLGLMDGTFLTALRTGAASAIASKILAHPSSKIIGLVGCGAQAVAQAHALSRIFKIEKFLIHDIEPDIMNSFPARLSLVDLDGIEIEQPPLAQLLRNADVLCTCTSIEPGRGPLFEEAELRAWLHINAVGSDFPGKVELPRTLLQRGFVSPDFRKQAIREGECQQLREEEIGPDLVELVQNQKKYRSLQEKVTVFDSTGWALQDQVALEVFMEYAKELNVGSRMEIESMSMDPRNPYHFVKGFSKGSILQLEKRA